MKQKCLETEKWTFFLTKGRGVLAYLYFFLFYEHTEKGGLLVNKQKEIIDKGGGRKCCRPVFINSMSIYIKGIYESASNKK